jgi:hypothetical protein
LPLSPRGFHERRWALFEVVRVAPSSACRHLLPTGEKRLVAGSAFPFSPRREGGAPASQRFSSADRHSGAPDEGFSGADWSSTNSEPLTRLAMLPLRGSPSCADLSPQGRGDPTETPAIPYAIASPVNGGGRRCGLNPGRAGPRASRGPRRAC